MAKNKNIEIDNIPDVEEIFNINIEKTKQEVNKNGYIKIKLKNGGNSTIGIHESQFGTIYKEDKWEKVEDKKK